MSWPGGSNRNGNRNGNGNGNGNGFDGINRIDRMEARRDAARQVVILSILLILLIPSKALEVAVVSD